MTLGSSRRIFTYHSSFSTRNSWSDFQWSPSCSFSNLLKQEISGDHKKKRICTIRHPSKATGPIGLPNLICRRQALLSLLEDSHYEVQRVWPRKGPSDSTVPALCYPKWYPTGLMRVKQYQKPPIENGLYHPFMVKLGWFMVYCVTLSSDVSKKKSRHSNDFEKCPRKSEQTSINKE